LKGWNLKVNGFIVDSSEILRIAKAIFVSKYRGYQSTVMKGGVVVGRDEPCA
jgi:hypothetical protein